MKDSPAIPSALKKPHVTVHMDERRSDDYYWLREKDNPEVLAYLCAENEYAEHCLQGIQPLQKKLYAEMLQRIQENDLTVPYQQGNWEYLSRTEQAKQYPIYLRRPIHPNALPLTPLFSPAAQQVSTEQVLLDLNLLAQDKPFIALGDFAVSPDGNWLAYSLDDTGFRQYTLYIKNLRSGLVLPMQRERVTSIAWANDNQTLFYVTEDEQTKRSNRLFRYQINANSGSQTDPLIFEEFDALFRLHISRDLSGRYLFAQSQSFTTSEVRYIDTELCFEAELSTPASAWRLLAPRLTGRLYDVTVHDNYFYIRTDDQGKNFRLIRTPLTAVHKPQDNAADAMKRWEQVVPHRNEILLEAIHFFKEFSVMELRENGLPHIVVTDLRNGSFHRITFPDPAYALHLSHNKQWDAKTLRYVYESFTTPESVFEYHIDTQQSVLLKQRPVLGGFDAADYVSERRFVQAEDNTLIPVSLVYRKGVINTPSMDSLAPTQVSVDTGLALLAAAAPVLLTAYGAYGYAHDVYFSSSRLSLLDRGVVFVLAHVRGGGEMGRAWHDAGRLLHKKNTFTDFIRVAEYLIENKLTVPEKLVIEGGSAGGLLMGAVTNMRPELFKLVILQVPFVDVVNTMLDETLPLTVGEYEEWGNPNNPDEYAYIRSYSPYDNLQIKPYPAIFVRTSLNDSQVMYWEPAKYVAKLREIKQQLQATTVSESPPYQSFEDTPLLFLTHMNAGHGGASGRYDYLQEVAVDYAFILNQLGIHD